MIGYVFAFSVVASMILGLVLIGDPTVINLVKFISQILIMLVSVGALLIGNRFPTKFARVIAVGILLMHLITALTIDLVLNLPDGTFVGMQARIGGLFIYSLILAPSMKYMLFYTVIFYLNITQTIYRFVEDGSVDYHIIWLLLAFFLFSFWFIF